MTHLLTLVSATSGCLVVAGMLAQLAIDHPRRRHPA